MTNESECMLSPTSNMIVFPDIDDRGGALSVTQVSYFYCRPKRLKIKGVACCPVSGL